MGIILDKREPARKLVLNRSIKIDVIFDAMLIVCFRGIGGPKYLDQNT